MDIIDEMGRTVWDYAADKPETIQLLNYIKSLREHNVTDETGSKQQKLLELYDKTISDEHIDYNLLVTLIQNIHRSHDRQGSVLVFLPGYDDIMMCNEYIVNSDIDPTTIKIFFLHSSMNIKDQQEVFKYLPDRRKIILATNIAETSLTIDDIVFVIDTGKCKEKCFDSVSKSHYRFYIILCLDNTFSPRKLNGGVLTRSGCISTTRKPHCPLELTLQSRITFESPLTIPFETQNNVLLVYFCVLRFFVYTKSFSRSFL